MKKRFTEEQIIGFLHEVDAGMPVKELCRKHGAACGSSWFSRMAAVLFGLVNLLQTQKPFPILAKTAQAIASPTDRAHKVQAEAVEVGLGTSRELREFGMAADADPHAGEHTPAERQW
ncbi:hypothetical protein FHW84_000037 [Dyella sp. SG562]|nr:hypothetical protein [Dyella sp. SG562]NKJ22052.1 hypothetical protein [Dyella sp. SG609]